jgi:hypothetical protein
MPRHFAIAELSIAVCLLGLAAACVPRCWWIGVYAFSIPLLILHSALEHAVRSVFFSLAAIAAGLAGKRIAPASALDSRTRTRSHRDA